MKRAKYPASGSCLAVRHRARQCWSSTRRLTLFGYPCRRSNWIGWAQKRRSPASSWAGDLRTVTRN